MLAGATLAMCLAEEAEVGGVSINYQDSVDNVSYSEIGTRGSSFRQLPS